MAAPAPIASLTSWLRSLPHFIWLGAVVCITAGALLYPVDPPARKGVVVTGRELDLAILGRGYFVVHHERTNRGAYVRYGRLTLNGVGQLCFGRPCDDWVVQPQITFPVDHSKVEITHDGIVQYHQEGNPQPQQAGQLQLALFVADENLREIAPGVFEESQHGGVANISDPGMNGTGFLQQGFLDTAAEPIQASTILTTSAFSENNWRSTVVIAAIVGLLFYVIAQVRGLQRQLTSASQVAMARFDEPAAVPVPLRFQSHVGDGHLL